MDCERHNVGNIVYTADGRIRVAAINGWKVSLTWSDRRNVRGWLTLRNRPLSRSKKEAVGNGVRVEPISRDAGVLRVIPRDALLPVSV